MEVPRWLRRLAAPGPAPRTSGPPPSANGASSSRLSWSVPGELLEAAATLEVLEPPGVDSVYFWALQVSFLDGRRSSGAAHLGLQHHPGFPSGGAANWGGYRPGGTVLDGSASPLASTTGNPNTRDYAWRPGVPYRLGVQRSPERGWRGTIRDLERDEEVVVRDLWAGGDRLGAPVVWSEVFAPCDAPPVAVRWSDLGGVDLRGNEVRPPTVLVNYQSHADGGCANTNSHTDRVGVVQRTNTGRTVAQGSTLVLP